MKITVSLYDFERAFLEVRPDNFSYRGLPALFEYLENLEQHCGLELELDVIALCCDYTEYSDIDEFLKEYGNLFAEDEEPTLEKIGEHTTVIEILGTEGFIIEDF